MRQTSSPDKGIPDSLKHFDDLPDSAQVRAPVVAGWYGVTEVSVWRWARSGRIPAPKKISPGVTVWSVGELRRARQQTA